MKKNNIKYILMSVVVFVLAGCDDFLDLDPISQQTAETAWDSNIEVNSNVLGIYFKLRENLEFGGTYFDYGDIPAQIFLATESEGDHRVFNGDYTTMGMSWNCNWTRFYKSILSANLAIKKIPEIPLEVFSNSREDALKISNSYIGEALFLRAYTYFFMTRIWGAVPLVTIPVEDASEVVYDYPYETEDNILKQCLDDLDLALEYLSWDPTQGSAAVRANKGSAYALKMHIHMWLTRANRSEIDETNFEKAIECCNAIEASGKYQLLPVESMLTIWTQGKTAESLFEFPFNTANNEYFRKETFFSHILGYPMNTDRKDAGKPIYVLNSTFTGLYNPLKDKRIEYLYANFGKLNGYTLKYSSIHYLNTDKTDWRFDNNIVIFRLADMYLLKAEALYMLNQRDEALVYLNRVRDRAGLAAYTNTGTPLYKAINDERERELFLEGHRLYDWVRTGFYVTKSSGYDATRYYKDGHQWPVHFDLLINNAYARQTPYWQDKVQAYQ